METQHPQKKTGQKSLKVLIIVQARMGATRLPGKPMLLVKGRTLLSYLIERLKRVKKANGIVIATTIDPKDDSIVAEAKAHQVDVFCGSENDVLQRYHQAAQKYDADVVVRITADCPIIDPQIVDQCIAYFLKHSDKLDYLSNTLELTYPRGLDTEVFSWSALDRTFKEAKSPEEREHVTLYMYRHPEKFKLANIRNKTDLSRFRWTVDTHEDFHLIKLILEALLPKKPQFHLQDVVEVVERHPDWSEINAHVVQKSVKNPP